jgi:fructokinase
MIKVLSFGELLWDIIGGKAYIGGAPFNLASHLAKMGIQSTYISSVGKDDLGEKASKIAEHYGLDTDYISIHSTLPTGKVNVFLDKKGNPQYTINKNTAWDEIILQDNLKNILFKEYWDAFCFGTLAQRTKSNRELLYALIPELNCKNIFYDVNLRQNYYQKEWIEHSLELSNMLKLNEEEVATLSELLLGKVASKEDFCHAMSSKYFLKIICITLGESGSIVYDGQNCFQVPGVKVKVIDTVGAGDSYSAAFLFSFLSGWNPRKCGEFANQVGAFVASQSGAVPEYSLELKEKIKGIKNNINKNI